MSAAERSPLKELWPLGPIPIQVKIGSVARPAKWPNDHGDILVIQARRADGFDAEAIETAERGHAGRV
jgi:hypothetical protein